MTSELTTVSKKNRANEISTWWLLVAIAGYICYALFNRQVFPSASITYALTKDDAVLVARAVAERLNYDPKKTIQTTTFNTDDEAKTVLEFKLGIKKANELMRADVPVYYWRTRFCKELSKEQVYVAHTTNGQLMYVFHKLENDIKLPTLAKDEALRRAVEFISLFGKQDLSKYKLFDYGAEPRPNRTDQHFEWTRDVGFPDSNLHIRFEFAGDTLVEYRYFLQPSDKWTREYKRIRENNELLGKIASFFIFVFIAASVASFVHGLNTNSVRWRFALTCAAIVSILYALDQANSWTNTIDSTYDTSLTFANFATKTTLSNLLAMIGILFLSVILVGGAENVYRRCFPKHMSMPNLLSVRGMCQPEYLTKAVHGYLIVGGMMLWVICYYLIGEKLDFFCPLGVDDYRAVGTVCPAISAALIGVSAAGLEELTCRVVALGLLTKFLRNFWIANIIQAVVWGFAHSQYPQQPSYARGVELSVVGIVFGCITNVMGVFPCFVAHYLYDAFLTAEPVFATHQLNLTIPALMVLLPFLVVPVLAKRWSKRRGIENCADLTNAAETSPAPLQKHGDDIVDRSATTYKPLSKVTRGGLVIAILVGLGVAFLPTTTSVGDSKKVSVSRNDALILAKKYLAQDGVKETNWLTTTELVTKPDESDSLKWQYLFEQLGKDKLAKIYNETQPCIEWRVRFYKPLESKMYWVFLDGAGAKRACTVEDIDDGVGAKLNESQALEVVDNYIKNFRPEFKPYAVIGKSKIEHPERTDHKFEMLIPRFNAGATPGKLKAELKGSEISDLIVDWEVPDGWMWPRKTMKWYQQVDSVARFVAGAFALISLVGWAIYVLRATSISWRGPLLTTGIGTIAIVVSIANNFVKLLANYNTAENFGSFMAQSTAAESLKVLLFGAGFLLLSLAAFATVRLSFPSVANQMRHTILLTPHNRYERLLRSNVWIDGALSSYGFLALLLVLKHLQGVFDDRFSPSLHLNVPHYLPSMFSTYFPTMDLLTSVVSGGIFGLMLLALVAGLWKRFMRSRFVAVASTTLVSIIVSASHWYPQEIGIDFLYWLLMSGLALIFINRFFKANLIAYIFVMLEISSVARLGEIMQHAQKIAIPEISIIAVLVATPLVATLWVCFSDKQNKNESTRLSDTMSSPIHLTGETHAAENSIATDKANETNENPNLTDGAQP